MFKCQRRDTSFDMYRELIGKVAYGFAGSRGNCFRALTYFSVTNRFLSGGGRPRRLANPLYSGARNYALGHNS